MKKNIEFRNFEIKSMDTMPNGEMFLEGYGAIFGNIDACEDIIEKGAFAKTLSENKGRIAFCYQHEIDEPIGKIEEIKEDNIGLWLRVRISDACEEIKTKLQEGILKEMSVGFQTMISTYDENTDVRTIKEVKLWEVSLVTIAANPLAVVMQLKSIQEKEDYIEKCFDAILENITNRNTKFDLLKLKSLIMNMPSAEVAPQSSHIKDEPIVELKAGVNLSKFKFINN